MPETEASEQRGGEQRTGQKGKDDGSQRGCANHGGDRKGRWMVGGPWSVDGHGGGGWARGRGVVGSESSHRGYDTRAWERGYRLRCAGQRLQDLSRTAIGKSKKRSDPRKRGLERSLARFRSPSSAASPLKPGRQGAGCGSVFPGWQSRWRMEEPCTGRRNADTTHSRRERVVQRGALRVRRGRGRQPGSGRGRRGALGHRWAWGKSGERGAASLWLGA